MTTLTSIIAPSNVLTPSSTATVTNKTISGANNTISVCLTSDVSGALPVANGGFGQSSYTDGQLLIGNTAGCLTKTTLTAGCNIAITNSGGSITIAYDPPDVSVAYAWGGGGSGRLGNNDTADKNSPVSVVGGYTDWCQVSAGTKNSLALRTNGTAWGWGYNSCGNLGDNTTVSKSSPVQVVGGFTDWCQISAGGSFGNAERHSLAVRQNGTAWAWGSRTTGKLGNNCSTGASSSPISVLGGFTDWCQISAGNDHSLAVRTNGTAWAWGSGSNGELGDNIATARSSPVSVVGGFTDWCQISAADSQFAHSLGVRQNGTAWAWGHNGAGRLGDNTTTTRSSPVSVVGGFTNWCQVSGGNTFSVGVRQNGTAWAWGYNCRGQLGDNTAGENCSRLSPVQVVGGFTDWCQASAGVGFISAVRTNGTAWSWGQHNGGNLGDASGSGKCSPVSVVGGFTNWCQVSAGYFHTLGITLTVV